jgi:hypothetical protein
MQNKFSVQLQMTGHRADGNHGPENGASKLTTLATKKSRCWRKSGDYGFEEDRWTLKRSVRLPLVPPQRNTIERIAKGNCFQTPGSHGEDKESPFST